MKPSNISKWILGIGILSILSPFGWIWNQNRQIKNKLYENTISYLEQAVPKLNGSALDRDDAYEINHDVGDKNSVSLAELIDYERNDKTQDMLKSAEIQIGRKISNPFGNSEIRITSSYNEERKFIIKKGKRKKWVENVHYGLDMTPEKNSSGNFDKRHPIYATQGIIEFIGRNGKHGRTVVIKINEENNSYLQYSHFSRLNTKIKAGNRVNDGQWLGNMGNSGDSHGSHLHIERFTLPYGISYDMYYENMKRKKKDRLEWMAKSYTDPTHWLADDGRTEKRIKSLASIVNFDVKLPSLFERD